MGLLSPAVLPPVNAINDHVETIIALSELGPLIDDRGPDYWGHAIILLSLIEAVAKQLSAEMDALVEALRACREGR